MVRVIEMERYTVGSLRDALNALIKEGIDDGGDQGIEDYEIIMGAQDLSSDEPFLSLYIDDTNRQVFLFAY